MAVPSGRYLTTPARILVVDDHPTVREGLAVRIARQPDMRVCGEAATQAEAIRQLQALDPDLAVVDLSLKDGHGLSLIKRMRASGSTVKVLVHSMFAESLYGERALQAGAKGYVSKDADPDQVIEAIRCVLAGRIHVSEELMQRLLGRGATRGARPSADPVTLLSNRELEILNLIGQGLTSSQIAQRLHLSIHTIDSHRENLKTKLGLDNSVQLVCFATRWGLENA